MNLQLSIRTVAIIVACICAWAWMDLPVVNHPLGSDWGHYFTAAEFIWMPSEGVAYPDFRKPWFGWILGGLGSMIGYLDAALLLGRLSMVCLIGSAALLGAALGNRWAGLAAAATVPMMPLVMDGALWVNHYPLLSAMVGLSFAAGAAACRWPSLGWVALAAFASGAALALDLRGSIGPVAVLALVALGSLGEKPARILVRLGLFGLVFGMVSAHDSWLQTAFDVPQLEFEQQLQVQRRGTLQQIQQGTFANVGLEQACASEREQSFSIDAAFSECGHALRSSGHARLAQLGLLPPAALMWIAVVGLIPARDPKRWAWVRSVGMSATVFGGACLSLWVGMSWVTYFDRYVMPMSVVMAVAAPVAFARVATWSRLIPAWLAALGGVAFALWGFPGHGARDLDAPEKARSSEYHAGEFARWAQTSVSEQDHVLDCAGLAVDSLLLPRRINYMRFPPGDDDCVARMRSPGTTQGTFYLITMHRDIPPHLSPASLPFNAAAIAQLGFEPVDHDLNLEGYRLWSKR